MNTPRIFCNFRPNTPSGCLENEEVALTFNEWWNGEGVDIEFQKNHTHQSRALSTSLHLTEIHYIAVVAVALGLLDIHSVNDDAAHLLNSVNKSFDW